MCVRDNFVFAPVAPLQGRCQQRIGRNRVNLIVGWGRQFLFFCCASSIFTGHKRKPSLVKKGVSGITLLANAL